MVVVRLFGVFRLKSGLSRLNLDIKKGSELFKNLSANAKDIPESEWEKSVLYLNGKPVSVSKLKKIEFSEGDEILLMSPVSGG